MIKISDSTIDCKNILTSSILFQGNECDLLKTLTNRYNVTHKHIVFGNSAVSLVNTLIKNINGPIGIFVPEFFKYLEKINNKVLLARTNSFQIPNLSKEYDVTFRNIKAILISNPHNPTGLFEDLIPLIKKAKEHNTIVIVDEAYIEFFSEQESLAFKINEFDNLIVIRTYSKFFGLKNDKVAYAIANYDLIEYIKNVQEPSDIALRVAAKLESSSHKILAKSEVNRRKDRLQQLLKNIGCDIIPSSANFIMARHNNNLSELLKSQSIDCMCLNNQVGLENKGYCRIAVGGSYDIQEIMKRLRR